MDLGEVSIAELCDQASLFSLNKHQHPVAISDRLCLWTLSFGPVISGKVRHRLPAISFPLLPQCFPSQNQIGPPPPWDLSYGIDFMCKFGAGEGIRTLDPNLGKVVLYP
jgi:hypothetical protein